VVEKKDVTASDLTAAKNSLRDELLNERRNRFYAAYMTKAREKMKININRGVLQQLTA
jgi:hypothetical protein